MSEHALPRDVALLVGQVLAVVMVLASVWVAHQLGAQADRDYPTPPEPRPWRLTRDSRGRPELPPNQEGPAQ